MRFHRILLNHYEKSIITSLTLKVKCNSIHLNCRVFEWIGKEAVQNKEESSFPFQSEIYQNEIKSLPHGSAADAKMQFHSLMIILIVSYHAIVEPVRPACYLVIYANNILKEEKSLQPLMQDRG